MSGESRESQAERIRQARKTRFVLCLGGGEALLSHKVGGGTHDKDIHAIL